MTMKAFLKIQDFVDFFAFLSCVTPTNITGFTRSLDGFIGSDLVLKTNQRGRESGHRIAGHGRQIRLHYFANKTLTSPPPKFSQRIWTIHENDLWRLQKTGIPVKTGKISCLNPIGGLNVTFGRSQSSLWTK